jgi:hypothetical protein
MMKFWSTSVVDPEKSVFASGLFSVWIFMWESSFFGTKKLETAIATLMHILIVPVGSALWNYVVGIGKEAGAALVVMLAAWMAWRRLTDRERREISRQCWRS